MTLIRCLQDLIQETIIENLSNGGGVGYAEYHCLSFSDHKIKENDYEKRTYHHYRAGYAEKAR